MRVHELFLNFTEVEENKLHQIFPRLISIIFPDTGGHAIGNQLARWNNRGNWSEHQNNIFLYLEKENSRMFDEGLPKSNKDI